MGVVFAIVWGLCLLLCGCWVCNCLGVVIVIVWLVVFVIVSVVVFVIVWGVVFVIVWELCL